MNYSLIRPRSYYISSRYAYSKRTVPRHAYVKYDYPQFGETSYVDKCSLMQISHITLGQISLTKALRSGADVRGSVAPQFVQIVRTDLFIRSSSDASYLRMFSTAKVTVEDFVRINLANERPVDWEIREYANRLDDFLVLEFW